MVIWSSVRPGFHAQVVVIQVDVEVRQDQFVLDEMPDDARHFVPVELDDGVFDFDLGHRDTFTLRESGGV